MALINIETIMDGIENYDIGTTISRGTHVKINIATCRRGRLKGRKVALKTISKEPNNLYLDDNSYRAALRVHRHLHHPDILSLLSTFESPSAFYEILEYCPNGSLLEWMSPSKGNEPQGSSTMTEPQLRGVLQPLIKALLHMHQDKLLHLSVNPSNIFITSDYRVKLGGFQYSRNFGSKVSGFFQEGHGQQLAFGDKAPIRHQKSLFSAPEILMQESFGPGADVWSLGQLCVLLSSGTLQDDGLWNQSIPESASYELRDLIDGLTQADALDRTPLHRILSHPFFNPALPIDNLSSFLRSRFRGRTKSTDYETHHGRVILGAVNVPRDPFIMRASSIVVPRRPSIVPQKEERASVAKIIFPNPERMSMDVTSRSKTRCTAIPHLSSDRASRQPPGEKSLIPSGKTDIESRRPRSPPGRTRSSIPHPLVIAGVLPAQTFRTPHGAIVIQSSGSVLVDLREGERMKGRRGGVVLVVRSEGTKIDVHSAPHLSVPCVLQAPISTWDICKLPSEFAKPYDFAAKYLQVVRRRTPMVTLDLSNSKFIMMSNLPRSDIEMTVLCPDSSKYREPLRDSEPVIRLRLSRQEDTLEISQFNTTPRNRVVSRIATQSFNTAPQSRVTEWSKRTIFLVNGHIEMGDIREEERKAVNCLQGCKAIWEQFEKTALDLDLHVTNTLSDQFRTIKAPLDVLKAAIEGVTTLATDENSDDDVPAYPSPDSVNDLLPRNKAQMYAEEAMRPSLTAPSTKPRLGGLGLPPRPRRLSISNIHIQKKALENTSMILPERQRSAIRWSASIKSKHAEVLTP